MTIDEQLRALRDIVQIDVGNRGLARDPVDNLFTACPDDFENACRSIALHSNPFVGIVTGFMIPSVLSPWSFPSTIQRHLHCPGYVIALSLA